MTRSRPHSSNGPEPVRCTDCGNWRLFGKPCSGCFPLTLELELVPWQLRRINQRGETMRVRCTDCGGWRSESAPCRTCYPTMLDAMNKIQADWQESEDNDL